MFSSLRTIFMILVLASISAGSAAAATLQVLIDTDNSAASGCTVTLPSPPGGTFPGVEVVLTTTVDTSTTPPSVTGVTQQLCNTATHTLGTAAVVSPGGWNVAMGAGVGGYDAIETVYTPASLAGAYRLGFTYTDGAIGSDVLTASGTGPGATPIVFALAAESSAVGVPGLQGGGVLLLSALLAGAMIWGLRRYRAPTLLVFALVSCILAGGTWAAITLDGSVADWTGISPLAADATGDGPAGADIAAVFATTSTSPNRVFFRADVKVAAKPGITSSDHTSFSVGTAGSFTVTTSGIPVPSLSRGGVALPGGVSFTDNGNGTGTLSGTPAAASDGSYALNFTATNLAGSSSAQAYTLTVTKQTQTITFSSTAPSNPALGGAPYVVSATATSGLPVTFTIAPAAASVCTIAGNTVSYMGAGTCVINANQAGDSTYGAAPQVQQSFSVAKTAQTISFTSSAPGAATVGGPTYTVAATATSGLPVSFAIDASSAAVCSLAGSTVSFIGNGNCRINANQSGNATYDVAPQVQQNFAVGAGGQTISFTSTAPTAAAAGGASYSVTATATSGLPVSFAIDASATSVCALSGSTVSFLAAGTCKINANQAGNSNYSAAPQVQQSFTVRANQTISFTSSAPANPQLNGPTYTATATATSGLPVTLSVAAASASVCSLAGSTVSFIGVGTCTLNADQAGNASYAPAPQVQQSFSVAKTAQTISFSSSAPGAATVGGPTYAVAATATSGLTVSLAIDASSTSVCSLAGSTVSFIGSGTCRINANQSGNATYGVAPQVQQSFAVGAGSQTISFTSTAPTAATVGGATYGVTATATSGLTVSLTVDPSATSVCSLSGSTVSFLAMGTCKINANQAGNGNYSAAPQVQQSFTVRGLQTISFTSTPPASPLVGGPTYTVATTATSGLPVSLSVAPASAAVCSLSGSAVSFNGVGTCTLNADQAGDANYAPAAQVQQSFTVKNGQTISFTSTAPTAAMYGDTYTVTATATSGLSVTLAIDASATSICSLSGNVVSMNATGNCVVVASQAGNGTFAAATPVQQSFTVGPRLQGDSYSVVGNTQLVVAAQSAPTTPFVAAATGVLNNDSADVSITLTPVTNGATAGGGLITLDGSGAFTYTPPAGQSSGTDTFDYTGTANGISRQGRITFNIANVVWYVDSAATGGSSDGRSNSPFQHMGSGAAGLGSALSNAGPGAGAFIYVAKGAAATPGAYTLKSSQTLIGAGATLNVPTSSPVLTIAGVAANTPTVTGTLSASGVSGVVVDGLSLSTGGSPAVNLLNTGGNFTFRSVAATGTSNGIVLQHTTGSFTVTGDGSNASVGGNGSGGTLSNMSGSDGAMAGSAVYLNDAQNVTLRRMTINGSNSNYGIRGYQVNGFTLEYSTVSGVQGTAASLASPENAGEGSIYFGNTATSGVSGTVTFTNNVIQGGRARNLSLINTTGTATLVLKGNTFGLNQSYVDASQSLAVEALGSGTAINTTVGGSAVGEGNTFLGAPGDLANFTGQAGTTFGVVFKQNSLSNTHPNNNVGGGGLTLGTQGTMTLDVDGNALTGADGSAITLFKANGGTSMVGHVRNNTIGNVAVAGSGSKSGNGLFLSFAGAGVITLDISNNAIRQYLGNAGIYADNTDGSYTLNATIKQNVVDATGTTGNTIFAGVALTSGSPSLADTIKVCADVASNDFSTADPANAADLLIGGGGQNAGSIFQLPGAFTATQTGVQTYLQNRNNNPGTTAVSAYVDSPSTFSGLYTAVASCPTAP